MTPKSRLTALALLATALVSASGAVCAAEPGARGFYVGASGGVTTFDDDGAYGGYDDDDSGWGLYAGYKVLKYLSFDVRYTDVGFRSSIISGHVVGIVPFGASGWELFGQLGAGSADVFDGFMDSETVYSAGLGVRFYPTSHLGISLQTDAWVYEEDDDHAPGFGATQLAVHWLF